MQNFIFDLMFKDKMYTEQGMSFQNLFNKLLSKLDPEAHLIQQYGGDKFCDGYSPKLDIHFALTTIENKKLKKKFLDDFSGYMQNQKSTNFVFVYPRVDIRIQMSDVVQTTQENNSDVNIQLWGFNDLLTKFRELEYQDKCDVLQTYPVPADSHTSGKNSVVPIILEIITNCNDESFALPSFNTNLPELKHKLFFNKTEKLTQYISDAANLVASKEFFNQYPELEEKLSKYVNKKYNEVKQIVDIDADTIVYMVMKYCYPNIKVGNFLALLNVMSHVIELCDLLDPPPPGWQAPI